MQMGTTFEVEPILIRAAVSSQDADQRPRRPL